DARGGRAGGGGEREIEGARELTAGAAAEPDRGDAALPARLNGAEHARRFAARRDGERHVALLTEGTDLPGEHLLVAVVVGDRRQGGRVGGERDRRQGLPLVDE